MSQALHEADRIWGSERAVVTVARTVSARYLVIGVDALLGLLLLPLNVQYFGPAGWGLWMLTASVTTYFSVLNLGYGASMTRFVAQCRARRDARSLNEILSTTAVLFAGIGLVACAACVIVAFNFDAIFTVAPDQAATGRTLLLITGLYVAVGFPFSVFGGVMNGFQRYDLNSLVSVCTSVVVAAVNAAMVLGDRSLVELVAVTTSIRMLAYLVYRSNAYRVFPALSLKWSLARRSRLREVTGFSVYIAMIDWSNRVNFGLDAIIIGAFLGPASVAVWMIGKRLTDYLQRFTNPFGALLFPMVVDSDTSRNPARLRAIFLEGTRLSLATAVPPVVAMLLLTGPLITAWVGPGFEASVVVTQVLVLVVVTRMGIATSMTVLKGGGRHRMLAWASLVTASVNMALSLVWIQRYGLIGQALGTLLPVAAVSVLVYWPLACRRVGMSIAEASRRAVWTAVWPAAVMAPAVVVMRDALPLNLPVIAAIAAAGGLCYAATFLMFAVTADERRIYISRLNELVRRSRQVPAAA